MSSQSLANYTPHPVVIYQQNKEDVLCTIPSSGVIRLKSYKQDARGTVRSDDGHEIPCVEPQDFYDIDGDIPASAGGIIVSMSVAQFLAERQPQRSKCAVFVPATGPAFVVRDDKGNIKGVTALERYLQDRSFTLCT